MQTVITLQYYLFSEVYGKTLISLQHQNTIIFIFILIVDHLHTYKHINNLTPYLYFNTDNFHGSEVFPVYVHIICYDINVIMPWNLQNILGYLESL